MPWFPEFTSAVELARRQTRAAGRADPVAQYFTALNNGDTRALETVWPGEVVIYDPRAGEVRGHRQLRRFVSQNQSWLTERHARIETVAATYADGRAVVEMLAHLADDGQGDGQGMGRATDREAGGNWPGRSRSSPNPPTIGRWCSVRTAANGPSTDGATSGRPYSRPGQSAWMTSSPATRPRLTLVTPKRS